jgi:16S rRNA processing protein RimM
MADPVVVAHVGRARGLGGDVVLRGEPEELALVSTVPHVYVDAGEEGGWTRMAVEPRGRVKDGIVFRLSGVTDRTGAERLRGAAVGIELDDLSPPRLDAWAWVQIEGFEVVTTGGESLGTITDRIRTGATDVLVVTGDEREVLVPAAPDVLRELDAAARRLVIEPIPGLLDLNE